MPSATKELHFFVDEANFRSASVDYAAYHANFGDRKPAPLILRSEALRAQPGETLARIAGFLGLGRFPPLVPVVSNGWKYAQPIGSLEWELLADTFAGDIRELGHLLGWNCASWLRRPEVDANAT